jgi:hypothetical protein
MFAICSPYNKAQLPRPRAENKFLWQGRRSLMDLANRRISQQNFPDASETCAQRGFSKTDFEKSCFQRT